MKTYIVGNWKMNFTVGESSLFLQRLLSKIRGSRSIEVIVAPSTVALQPLSLQVDRHRVKLSAQDVCAYDSGAYTGETSVSQLRSLVDYAIIGHSERRAYFSEDNKAIRAKASACVRAGITPIICIGETARERRDGETADVVRDQLLSALSDISVEDLSRVIIAYEPVWAISSTKGATLASPDKISPVIELIRRTLISTYGREHAESVPILYGGSVRPTNSVAYLSIPEVNGLLVGGASLISSEFIAIIDSVKNLLYE